MRSGIRTVSGLAGLAGMLVLALVGTGTAAGARAVDDVRQGAVAATAAASDPASASLPALGSASASGEASATKTVSYLGRNFTVPADWPVIDLTMYPHTCVLFDAHAVYLGLPGREQNCPASAVGRRTGALLIEPSLQGRAAPVAAQDDSMESLITASSPGVDVTASYGDDRGIVLNALAAAGLPTPNTAALAKAANLESGTGGTTNAATNAATGAFATGVDPTSGTAQAQGSGFDTCTAPTSPQMQTWMAASPYRNVGIYLGGSDFACPDDPNLTPAWLTTQSEAGWHTMPIWVGPQVAFSQISSPAAQGTQNADAAIAAARALGYNAGTLIYYDMEAYSRGGSNTTTAMTFLSAWTAELHANGFLSAVYSSESSGIDDLVANLGKISEPDVLSVANWNGNVDDDPGAAPSNEWSNARVHQYQGGHDETYGGAKLNIDCDFLNVSVSG
jgi:hypothetical protein